MGIQNPIKKGLAVAVIFLFAGMSIIPSTGTTIVKKSTMPTSNGNTLYVSGSGNPPVANFTIYNESSVGVVYFDGSLSYDLDGIIISYEWDFDDGAIGNGEYVIHQYCDCGTYDVTLTVTDNDGLKGNLTKSIDVILANIPPPDMVIDGPTSGNVGTEYDYTFYAMFPEGIIVFFLIDWGDGNNTGWIGPYWSFDFVTLTHSWSEKGTYIIKAKAKDFCREGDWTTSTMIVVENEAPTAPDIDGPTSGTVGTEYEYTFTAVDPDGDDIFLWIEWGDGTVEQDGWIGPYNSGEEITVSHTWSEQGTYTIGAKAKDVFDTESEWGTLEVKMPVNQQSSNSLFLRFLERFPNAFPILRLFLKL